MAAAVLPPPRLAEDDDLAVLSRWFRWRDAANGARQRLNAEAQALLERRRQEVAALRTAQDWRQRQATVRRTLHDLLGPFPERTPLNAQVTGVVRKPGYRIEHVIFESRPQFYVTACLFVPERLAGQTPAIVNPIGHSDIGFRESTNQVLALNLVRKGFIVLCFDPVGQGERVQYLDPATGRSRLGGCTREHSHLTRQTLLTGRSRPLLRLGRHPRHRLSAGPTGGRWPAHRHHRHLRRRHQTAYISALDERLAAAAPTCYITSLHLLLESLGPQDGEQNLLGGVLAGLDHADYLEVQAPRPILGHGEHPRLLQHPGRARDSAPRSPAPTRPLARQARFERRGRRAHGFTPVSRSISPPSSSRRLTCRAIPARSRWNRCRYPTSPSHRPGSCQRRWAAKRSSASTGWRRRR